MPKQLNIRSDLAYERATMLARRLNTTTTEVVVRALDDLSRKTYRPVTYEELTDEERGFVDDVLAKAKALRATLPPDVTSDHGDMYDENGLPK